MPIKQPWVDPNTGATFPLSVVVPRVDGFDLNAGVVTLSERRYASAYCYSQGYQPIWTGGTQISGATYASWFGVPLGSAQSLLQSTILGAAGSFLAGAPEYSGAAFF